MKYNEWRVEKIQWAAMILIRIVIANILYGPKMACSYLCKTPCRVPMTIKPKTTGLLSIALIFRVCELKFEIESQPTEFHFIEWIFFRYYNSGARKPISKLRPENRNCVCVCYFAPFLNIRISIKSCLWHIDVITSIRIHTFSPFLHFSLARFCSYVIH